MANPGLSAMIQALKSSSNNTQPPDSSQQRYTGGKAAWGGFGQVTDLFYSLKVSVTDSPRV
jgi:hypothetical protein